MSVKGQEDCTSLIVNPNLLDGTNGWTLVQKEKGAKYSYYVMGSGSGCIEAWNTSFDIYQIINNVQNGVYTATVQGFYREGGGAYLADPTTRINGTEEINAFLYANDSSTPLMSIFDCAQNNQSGAFTESTSIGYVPTDMSSASQAFSLGYYSDNSVTFRVTDGIIRLGIKSDKVVSGDWTIFDNFKLYYNGSLEQKQCETPTINFSNGELVFSCSTENAEINYDISTTGSGKVINNTFKPNIRLTVTAWATADGYYTSEKITSVFDVTDLNIGKEGDVNKDGKVDISDIVAVINIIAGVAQ